MKSTWPPALVKTIHARMGLTAPPSDPLVADLSERRKRYSRARQQENGETIRMPWGTPVNLLTSDEVVRRVSELRYSSDFSRGPGRVPLKPFAEVIGLHRDTLYEVLASRRASVYVRSKVTWGITLLEQGRLHFRRRGQVWQVDWTDRLAPRPPRALPFMKPTGPEGTSTFGGPDLPPWKP